MARRCLSGCAPQYLATYCVPVSSIAARQHLRSAVRHQLAVPSHCLSTYGRRAFAIAGPTMWNSLPTHLRHVENSTAAFGRLLKTHLFSGYLHIQRIRGFGNKALYKSTFYLLS